MSSFHKEIIVARVEVGGNGDDASPKRLYLSEKHTVEVVFKDFANIPHEVDDCMPSPTFSCHGREWMVRIFPGGCDEEYAGNISLFLYLRSEDRNVKAKYTLRIPAAQCSGVVDFKGTSSKSFGHGQGNICTRDRALSSLDEDGTLVAYVDIQIYTAGPPKWEPNLKRIRHDIATLFEMTQLKDVTFSVGGTTFEAHRPILLARAPALAALAEDVSQGTIPLNDTEASDFKSFHRFLYTCEAPSNLKSHAIQFLEMADRFGCVHLKLLAESELETSLKCDNAADLLLLADRKNCALLKESALIFIAGHEKGVFESAGWSKLSESASLLAEIFGMRVELGQASSEEDDESDFSKMRVAKLRTLLEAQGLDVDGSKEMLIKRLQEAEAGEGSDEEQARKRRRIE